MTKKILVLLVLIGFTQFSKCTIKERIVSGYNSLKSSVQEKCTKTALPKIGYAFISYLIFADELSNPNDIDNKDFDTRLINNLILFSPNILANYLILKDEFSKKKQKKEIIINNDSEDLSKAQKLTRLIKSLYKTKEGKVGIFKAIGSGIAAGLTGFAIKANFEDNSSDIASRLKYHSVLTAPLAYLSYRWGSNSVESIKNGYNKVA